MTFRFWLFAGAHRLPTTALLCAIVAALGALLSGCSDQQAHRPSFAPSTTLTAALATGCAFPSTQAQTTALPPAGGVSGTISLGAFAQASTVCLALTVATGADATLSGSSAQRRTLATTLPTPLLQVQLTNTYTGTITWTSTTLSVNVGNMPAGQYPATITSTTLEPGGASVSTTVTNFTVTVDDQGVAVVNGPLGALALSTLAAGTNSVLSIYPAGTVLSTPAPSPTPASSPSPAPSPTPSASASPSPAPTSSPSPAPTPSPSPAPTSSPAIVTVSLQPATCQQVTSAGGTLAYTATASAPPPPGVSFTGGPHTWYYGWAAGGGSGPAWTVTVPPPTTIDQFNGQIVGTANTATVTVPSFGSTGLTGTSGFVLVELYLDGDGGQLEPGVRTQASAKVAVGTIACGTF